MTYQVAVSFTEAEALAVLGLIESVDRTPEAMNPALQSVYEELDAIAPECEWCGERMNDEEGRVEERRTEDATITAHADCFATMIDRDIR